MRLSDKSEEVCFGRFRLDFRRHRLLHDGEPVPLGGRALDILRVLAFAEGAVVSKDELMGRLWPGRTVAENNLHVHISALRKALDEHGEGDTCIMTVPGRGYRLTNLSAPELAISNGLSSARHLPLPEKPSIAVLPFANLSADPEQEYFVAGVVEEIITVLSRIRWLFVIARSSSFIYKGQSVDVKRVGRELGVRYVLEGSVRKAGGRIRITAELIDAESGAHMWANHFEGSLEDVFEIQDMVAARVAGAIAPALRATEIQRSSGRPTHDLPAYDLFLRAVEYYDSHDRDGVIRALELLEQAIAGDPSYGDALSLAAQCRATLHVGGWADDADANRRQGVDLARRALRVAGDDPVVLARVAYVLGNLGEDIDAAIALIDRSLAMTPNLALGWHHSGWLRLWAGQADLALQHLVTAERLNPHAKRLELAIGIGHFFARRFEEARARLLRSLQEFPGWVANYRFLAACCAHMGRLDEAREMVQRLRTLTPLVVPTAEHWRDPQQRELYLSGLRLAAGNSEVTD
jgi:TolB-like protein